MCSPVLCPAIRLDIFLWMQLLHGRPCNTPPAWPAAFSASLPPLRSPPPPPPPDSASAPLSPALSRLLGLGGYRRLRRRPLPPPSQPLRPSSPAAPAAARLRRRPRRLRCRPRPQPDANPMEIDAPAATTSQLDVHRRPTCRPRISL